MVRASVTLETGERFEVLATLGEGGSGAVYMARDVRTGERVAVKALRGAGPDGLARFKQEFRVLTELHHPNLVELRELFEHEGRWFIVMSFVPGSDLLKYVRPAARSGAAKPEPCAPPFDLQRLVEAFSGIAQGLMALHGSGALHRDLKPSNVCVTPEGRAVLLDFGLVTSADPRAQSSAAQGLGTVAYMAPEQAQASALCPATDWYAFGSCLYEALTGRLPFDEPSSLQLLLRKQSGDAPARAASLQAGIPPELDQLCARLLDRDPEGRPQGAEVVQVLERLLPPSRVQRVSPSVPPTASLPPEAPFAGREREMATLHSALSRAREGQLRIVFIEGESGIGKTELMHRFVHEARARHPGIVALSGRCYENEHVPYKAFDGCIDQLARHLARLDEPDCEALLPRRAALLAQLFPVLRQVEAIARAPQHPSSSEPTARRLEAFDALAEMWRRLMDHHPVVLAIDDVHWSDRESFRLLRALVEHPRAPALLIVATSRLREQLSEPVQRAVQRIQSWSACEAHTLGRLSLEQSEELAGRLLDGTPDDWLAAVARECQGHPLFLQELVHFAHSRELTPDLRLTLDAAVASRLEELPKASRELLELVAVAGRPYPASAFARALETESIEDLARPLLMGKLLRRGRHHELSCFHDRIREIASSLVPEARLRRVHHMLARTLAELPNADPAERARHWELAGDRARAADAYEAGSRSALEALAFTRAAALCQRALSLLDAPDDPRHAVLLVRRADALSYAGHNAEAAALYEQAAERETGQPRLLLRSKVANHLLLSAQIASGLRVAQKALAEVGVSLPLRVAPALLRFLWEQLRFAVERRLPRRQDARRREQARVALSVIEELRRSIPLVHTPAFLALIAQHLRIAAGYGDPGSTTHAYATEGWLRSIRGPLATAMPLLDRGRRMADELGQPKLQIDLALAEGSAHLLHWHPTAAEACFAKAHALLLADDLARVSDLTFTRFQLGIVWYMLGRDAQLAREMTAWLAEARERRDYFGTYLLVGTGQGYMRHLMRDDPDAALTELTQARADLPDEPVASTFAHVGYVLAMQMTYAYKGGDGGLRWLEENQGQVLADATLGVGLMHETRALCRLMGLAAAVEDKSPQARTPYIRKARRHAKSLLRSKNPGTRALAELAYGQADAYEGRLERAHRRIARARLALGDEHYALVLRAQYLEGVLEGGAAGKKKCEDALARVESQGWKNPERAVTVGIPLARVLYVDGELKTTE